MIKSTKIANTYYGICTRAEIRLKKELQALSLHIPPSGSFQQYGPNCYKFLRREACIKEKKEPRQRGLFIKP